jgi:hypothetical protein
MYKNILFGFIWLTSLLGSPLFVLAANNSYGLTDYQYTKGLYDVGRLKVNNECMQPTFDAYGQGKVTIDQYNAEKDRCFIKSFEVIPKVAAGESGAIVSEEKPFGALENKYKERYVAKCMDTYKNNPSVNSCCSDLAVADTKAMQKRGVFDTATTAEIPIIIDENKCKPKEYKYDCSATSMNAGEKDKCKQYLNKCMEMGKDFYQSEETRKLLCEAGYHNNRPLELSRVDKQVIICLGSEKIADEDERSSRISKCIAEGSRALRDYVNRCIISANGGRFSRWFIWFRTVFSKVEKAKYESQSKECLRSYDAELDKKLAE